MFDATILAICQDTSGRFVPGKSGVIRAVSAAVLVWMTGVGSAGAACRPEGPPLTSEMVANFVALPSSLLSADATTERNAAEFATRVSQYAAADPAALTAMLNVIAQADVAQRNAIGQGLYRAYNVCTAVDQDVATRINKAARKINDPSASRAYQLAEVMATATGSPPPANDATSSAGPPSTLNPLTGNVTSDPMSLKVSDPFVLPEIR